MMRFIAGSNCRWIALTACGALVALASAGDVCAQQPNYNRGGNQRNIQQQLQRQQQQSLRRVQYMQRMQQQQQKQMVDALKKQGIENPEQLRAAQEKQYYESLSPGEKAKYDRQMQRAKAAEERNRQRKERGRGTAAPVAGGLGGFPN